ncbi:hypothetical protein LTR85_006025 [Meristemomyces frigidus]|nr:hypothetical protein LTR85_006025 [Meristemomyces frigidus]
MGPSAGPSHAALEQHNQAVIDDHRFAEAAVKAEARQMVDQASFEWQTRYAERGDTSPEGAASPGNREPTLEVDSTLQHIGRMYPAPTASNATMMERYLTMDVANDPFPLNARQALSDMGLDCGSMRTAEARSRAATQIANDITGAGKDTAPDLLAYCRAQSAPTDRKPRVWKSATMSRRTAGGAAHDAKRTKTG